jgi:sec-independent protein translocase protein TatB
VGIGYTEMLLVGIVALLVLGPEKLPGFARTVGGFVRKARESFFSIKREIEREIEKTDIRKDMELDLNAPLATPDPLNPAAPTTLTPEPAAKHHDAT